MSRVFDCRLLPLSQEQNGLDPALSELKFPFAVQRIYYLYELAPETKRGHHAHRKLEGVMVAATGSFEVELSDGKNTIAHTLNDPNLGLYIPSMIWRVVQKFSSDAICLVFASGKFEEGEMIYDYNEFLNLKGNLDL